MYTARVYKETRRTVRVGVADALRQTLPEPARAPPGFGRCETGTNLHGSNRRRQRRPSPRQERTVHRHTHQGRKDSPNEFGNVTSRSRPTPFLNVFRFPGRDRLKGVGVVVALRPQVLAGTARLDGQEGGEDLRDGTGRKQQDCHNRSAKKRQRQLNVLPR